MNDSERDMLFLELKLKLEGLDEKVEKITHVLLDGNGKPPMTVRVALLEDHMEQLEDDNSEEREDRKMPRAFWVGTIISSIISVVAILVSVV